ncbi:Protein required for hyphal anastomosis (HAM-2) [Ophiocordyceps sinensis CO18]|uniref:Protein required for hyphal anastomosis (HAM-2) n=1 Tax=Ophiocordyceps sinensis (strain Co18 / CGMCC 3.14243) TaxID=911162 RepID=T5AE30_OPHSC|nr:Protein required for hyphal anastomosis (HAM-2) [Ophiocordyceps sinensis CO18]
MYITIQETLNDPDDMSSSYGKLLELKPSLVEAMSTVTFRLRWGELPAMPHTQILLLFWKSILLVFGGTRELENLKRATSEMAADPKDKDTITASPLDYHAFRQEIVSKYPAYVPPQSLIPLEPDNNSLLPPLPNLSSRNDASTGIIPTPTRSQSGGASILDQPVHIATPAPSPPPSPGVGGKGGKKQNYQTNQNFPLMYPPLDATSNSAGGKGVAGMHDAVISRRWEGSDIPASILEAGELFSSRVRMSRATRQMWEERERFLKYERGWELESDDDEMVHLDLDELTLEEKQILEELKAEVRKEKSPPHPGVEVDLGPNPERLSDRDKQRLTAVENYYKNALPNMQSLVIVLLRPILVNVTAIVTQQAGKGGGPAMQKGPDSGQAGGADEPELSPEDVDAARMREITTKAMTGILILLLKWFRVSHVLKFEFLTQLLLDSNYIPLVLKLFAHQDIQQVVDSNTDRVENSFFQFCNLRSRVKYKMESDLGNEVDEDEGEAGEGHAEGELSAGDDSDNSDDSAASAPIKRRRSPEQGEGEGEEDPDEDSDEDAEEYAGEYAEEDAGEDADECAEEDAGSDGQSSTRPEVDELGNPVKPLPAEPITDFSRRNFFSLINYLRVMQKICKNKAHRNLLLMQYKSSTILRKSLRIPQEELRLYTLKLFKNQVPFCGRKWRQSNMRVITAVYLHCRPELRDEWLAGSGVDAEVEGALPLEQGLRSLTHWRDVRQYPDRIAPQFHTAMREEEQDFFKRELEKADVNWAAMGADDGTSEMEQAEGWA